MSRFYARGQGRDESISMYALSLQEIMKRAERRRGSVLEGGDALLRDRFLDGLRDRDLERQLRQYLRAAVPADSRTFQDIRPST
ncbi:Hypp600 [Branchiostoma lanceolatum]|uniref:Hypp600 protein n=1 Tax=Branchiostoma lanceolatum TaxID=7740 RepID=A0A8J9YQ84_BRALA|nr:Hypp600 [Branchiostoma lanceolatum]